MRLEKKSKPHAVCSVCQALSERRENTNQRCDQMLSGRRCSGRFQSSLTRLWDECQSCQGMGRVGTQPCMECKAFGWKLYS
jgi:hypothetical protein